MAIYDYKTSNVDRFAASTLLLSTPSRKPSSYQQAVNKSQEGDYQAALDLLKDDSDERATKMKAVLLLRLGRPGAATNLLRPLVWDSQTFSHKTDCDDCTKLNFATALLMTGHVHGCVEIVREVDRENEQAEEIRTEIRRWEKSLSILSWLDWKACGIEHVKGEFPINFIPGRFEREQQSTSENVAPIQPCVALA